LCVGRFSFDGVWCASPISFAIENNKTTWYLLLKAIVTYNLYVLQLQTALKFVVALCGGGEVLERE
jgi:hypothetical protein